MKILGIVCVAAFVMSTAGFASVSIRELMSITNDCYWENVISPLGEQICGKYHSPSGGYYTNSVMIDQASGKKLSLKYDYMKQFDFDIAPKMNLRISHDFCSALANDPDSELILQNNDFLPFFAWATADETQPRPDSLGNFDPLDTLLSVWTIREPSVSTGKVHLMNSRNKVVTSISIDLDALNSCLNKH